ncbi:sugar phosphate nucleotidyltransferase [Nonomuraea sp. NPDC003804]|uniref:sugar phosphate nucleotidyltransferase n=1 Tax=Nonomuraea sp. NPDC003804 TaxID=3154547 RepID=UPI0033A85FD6
MKALIIAADAGRGLRPLSHTTLPALLPICNEPALFYGLRTIRATGIEDVGIVTGRDATDVMDAVGDGARFSLNVQYLPLDRRLGVAAGVAIAREFLGDDDFVLFTGENLLFGDLRALIAEFDSLRLDALAMTGMAEASGEQVPMGLYVFSAVVHQAILCTQPTWRRELRLADSIQWLIDHGAAVRAHVFDGYWTSLTSVDDLLRGNRAVLATLATSATSPTFQRQDIGGRICTASSVAGKVVIEEGADVHASHIIGPALIGSGAEISGSRVGPGVVIGRDCVLRDTAIERSVVLDNASIHGIRGISDSVIGQHAIVALSPADSRSPNLVIGDHSTVLLDPAARGAAR